MRCCDALVAGAVLVLDAAHAQGAPAAPPRSVVLDHDAARSLRERADWSGVIVVEGVDDERRAKKPGMLEERFAAALNRTAPSRWRAPSIAYFGADPPCASLPSTIPPVGGNYNAHGFCP